MKLEEIIEQTTRLNSRFEKKFDKKDRVLDLVEEVGELAQAILIVEKRKLTRDPLKQKRTEDIADALADILFDLIFG